MYTRCPSASTRLRDTRGSRRYCRSSSARRARASSSVRPASRTVPTRGRSRQPSGSSGTPCGGVEDSGCWKTTTLTRSPGDRTTRGAEASATRAGTLPSASGGARTYWHAPTSASAETNATRTSAASNAANDAAIWRIPGGSTEARGPIQSRHGPRELRRKAGTESWEPCPLHPSSPQSRPMPRGQRTIVVMPAYNAAATLERTFHDLPKDHVDEVLVVDDCSKDDTVQVAERLGLTVIRHAQNK